MLLFGLYFELSAETFSVHYVRAFNWTVFNSLFVCHYYCKWSTLSYPFFTFRDAICVCYYLLIMNKKKSPRYFCCQLMRKPFSGNYFFHTFNNRLVHWRNLLLYVYDILVFILLGKVVITQNCSFLSLLVFLSGSSALCNVCKNIPLSTLSIHSKYISKPCNMSTLSFTFTVQIKHCIVPVTAEKDSFQSLNPNTLQGY
jgi:hypothetical protein